MLGLVLCNLIVPIPAILISRKVPTQIGNITGKRWIVYPISRASATTPPGVSRGEWAYSGHFFFRRHLIGSYAGSENYKYCRCWANV